jgi:hypothetical protein
MRMRRVVHIEKLESEALPYVAWRRVAKAGNSTEASPRSASLFATSTGHPTYTRIHSETLCGTRLDRGEGLVVEWSLESSAPLRCYARSQKTPAGDPDLARKRKRGLERSK